MSSSRGKLLPILNFYFSFSSYQERIQDGQPSLSVNVSILAAKVIRSLLGSPPDLRLMMAVMDFLLLVHPAASGFISFNPEAFYFKLWWGKPESNCDIKLSFRVNMASECNRIFFGQKQMDAFLNCLF